MRPGDDIGLSEKRVEATIYTETGTPALVIQGVRRKDGDLIIQGKALGSMYMDMVLHPRDFWRVLRVLCSWGLVSFLLLLPVQALATVFKRLRGRGARGRGPSAGGS